MNTSDKFNCNNFTSTRLTCVEFILKFSFADRVEVLSNNEMDDEVLPARALQVVASDEGHTFVLDEDALSEVLLQDHVKDRYVVVVSVAGAFRKGKSFLLDFFLRYMYAKVRSQINGFGTKIK